MSDKFFDTFVTVLLVLVTAAVTYPLYFVVIASISQASAVNLGQVIFLPKGLNLDGYKMILGDSRILLGYKNSVVYTLFGTFLAVTLTVLAGYALSQKEFIGRNIVMGVFVFTMYFQGGLTPSYLLVKNIGLLNKGITLIILGSFSVYNMIICRTFFNTTLSAEMKEASQIDGCPEQLYFLKIVLPLSKSIVAIMALYYAVGHWNSYFNALIYVYDKNLFPLQIFLREILLTNQTISLDNATDLDAIVALQNMSQLVKYGVLVVSSLPMLLLYPHIQKHFTKGVMIGAVKG